MLPYLDRFRVRIPDTRPVYKGLDRYIHTAAGFFRQKRFSRRRLLRKAKHLVDRSLEMTGLSMDELKHNLDQAREKEALDLIIPILCEISNRTLGMRPYPVQIEVVLVIQQGAIAEMATGEGKTLTAAFSAILFAGEKKPVHVLTSNDYLAQRDVEEMKTLFSACGYSVGYITGDVDVKQRPQVYNRDIVYTTAKELLADYLKERLSIGKNYSDLKRAVDRSLRQDDGSDTGMRGLHAVVIDEADNILIDEAVIPLILTAPRENRMVVEAALAARSCVNLLKKGEDYQVSLLNRKIIWNRKGEKKLARISGKLPNVWRGTVRTRELMETALTAQELFIKDEHYVILEGKVVLVDLLTGRLTPMRNLGIGLQQAVEAKEDLEISDPSEVIARMSFQKFFRMFPKIGGMSGTVKEVTSELWNIYHVPVVPVPTHRPIRRLEQPWRFSGHEETKYGRIVNEIRQAWSDKQPVLIGTRSVDISERLAGRLEKENIPCQVLNAVRHDEEAKIVSRAGIQRSVTIATNMAGRGTDIKLGEGVNELGGLYVICIEPQSSARLDRQLFGRSGRQGDPGLVVGFCCPEDPLIKRFVPRKLQFPVQILFRIGWPGKRFFLTLLVKYFQKKSERYSGKQRLAILKNDDWMEKHVTFPGGG